MASASVPYNSTELSIHDLQKILEKSNYPEANLNWLNPTSYSPLCPAIQQTEVVEGVANERFYIDETNLTKRRFLPEPDDLPIIHVVPAPSPAPAPAPAPEVASAAASTEPKSKPRIKQYKLSPKLNPPTSIPEQFLKEYQSRMNQSLNPSDPESYLTMMETETPKESTDILFSRAVNDISLQLKQLHLTLEQRAYIRELNVKISEIGELMDTNPSLPGYIWLHGVALVWNCMIILQEDSVMTPYGLSSSISSEEIQYCYWIQKVSSTSSSSPRFFWMKMELPVPEQMVNSLELSKESVFYHQEKRILSKQTMDNLKEILTELHIELSSIKDTKKDSLIEAIIPVSFKKLLCH
jgi:hypothetical protein